MKRLALFIFTFISLNGFSQTIPLNSTPRTPVSGQPVRVIWDQYFRAGKFMWIPYVNSTTPTFNNAIDSVGGGFQLTSDGYLNVSKGLGNGFFKWPNLDQVNTLITNATTGNTNILNQTSTLQAASFRISGTGQLAKVGLGSGATTSVNLDNRANITGAASATAELIQATIQSGVTTTAYGKRVLISTVASTFTLPNFYAYSASGGTTGAGSTLSSQTAYNVESSFTNANTNYGFRSNLSAASGVFSNYHPGTAQNYFNGNVTIGTTSDNGEKLQVNGKITVASPPTNPTDVVRKSDLDAALISITASNGLTKTGNNIALGGSLSGNTTIGVATSGNTYFNINPAGVINASVGGTGVTSSQVLISTTSAALQSTSAGAAVSNILIPNVGSNGISVTDQIGTTGIRYAADYSVQGKKSDTWLPNWGAVKTRVDSLGTLVGRLGSVNSWTNTNTYSNYIIANGGIFTNNGSFPRMSIGVGSNTFSISDDANTYQSFTPTKQTIANNGFNLDIKPPTTITAIRTQTYQDATGTIALIESEDKRTGWANYADNVYTVGSPFSISSGVTSTLPNNAATVINSQLPTGVTSFYNSSTTKITPELDGDYYMFVVRFKAKTTAANGGYLDFGIDIGGAMGIIFPETKPFLKGAGIEQSFSITCGGYSASTFVANGGLVKITAGSGNLSIYDISYQINRTHRAK